MTDDVHALAAAYALDALDPEERRRFEAHYPDCDACRTEVGEFRETAAHLGATTPTPLPDDLKARVLAEVSQTRQLPPRTSTSPADRRWVRPVLAAAAAIVIVAIAGGLYAWRSGGTGSGGGELAEVLGAPDAVTVRLGGTSPGTLRVVYSTDQGRAVVVGADVPDPGPGRTYQLWSVHGSTATSAGVFDPTSSGRVDEVVDAPAGPTDVWGVTNEPAGGSPAATGGMLYQGSA